jgi:tetratricopeptide (TPR) repeat protein
MKKIFVLLVVFLVGTGLTATLCTRPAAADTPGTLFENGISLQKSGRYDEALSRYDEALSESPDNSTILNKKMEVLVKLGRYDEAEETAKLSHANLVNSSEPSQYYYFFTGGSAVCGDYFSRGIDYLEWGNYNEALFYFKRVNEECPNFTNNVMVYGDTGYALYKLGRYDESVAAYDKALVYAKEKVSEYPGKVGYALNKEHIEIDRQRVLDKMKAPEVVPVKNTGAAPPHPVQTGSSETPAGTMVTVPSGPPATHTPLSPGIVLSGILLAGVFIAISRR